MTGYFLRNLIVERVSDSFMFDGGLEQSRVACNARYGKCMTDITRLRAYSAICAVSILTQAPDSARAFPQNKSASVVPLCWYQ